MSPAQISNVKASRGRSARAVPTTGRQMWAGAPVSLALHVLGIAAALFTFQNNLAPAETAMVPVDLIVAEATNVAAAAPPEPQETFERPQLDALPPPPLPEIAEPAPVEAKAPEFKVAPPPREQRNDINALLNQLTAPSRSNAREAPRAADAMGASNMATASLADALRSQIRNCWNPIPGAPNPAEQVVSFALRLNRDGSVASLELLAAAASPYAAAAAEAASRAIYQCQPYKLPLERYNQWQEFRPLRFDPRQMVGP